MKLYGIYHANGGLLGELAYVVEKISRDEPIARCATLPTAPSEQKPILKKFFNKRFQSRLKPCTSTIIRRTPKVFTRSNAVRRLAAWDRINCFLAPEDLSSPWRQRCSFETETLRHLDGAV